MNFPRPVRSSCWLGWKQRRTRPPRPRTSLWRLVLRFLGSWYQRRCHLRWGDVPATTNRLEGCFGQIEPRSRHTRGFHPETVALKFVALIGQVLASGYRHFLWSLPPLLVRLNPEDSAMNSHTFCNSPKDKMSWSTESGFQHRLVQR